MKKPEVFSESNEATYCPEDNKLRLYVGRVPREEYEALRAEGWTSTPKQSCDFVATWSPRREDTAISYAGVIGDEDIPPAERAADRAERFAGYLGKRMEEAGGLADKYEAGPSVHGYQNAQRAERAAARHDRQADRAINQWSKAEYWERRTAGVISHALYKDLPGVRMGRIKVLEAELRKHEEQLKGAMAEWAIMTKLRAMEDGEQKNKMVRHVLGSIDHSYSYKHPRPETVNNSHIKSSGSSIYTLMDMVERGYGTSDVTAAEACDLWFGARSEPKSTDRWSEHLTLRLAYENQMLEAQGGRAGATDMVPGGWLKGGRHLNSEERQIIKVNKSPATGRVVSVLVRDNRPSARNHYGNEYPDGESHILCHTVKVERMSPECYRAPTEAELAAFEAETKAAKKKAKETAAPTIPLINPTDEDAARLQQQWNDEAIAERSQRENSKYEADYKPVGITRISQEVYSRASQGSYARAETRGLHAGCELSNAPSNMWSEKAEARRKRLGSPACKIRITSGTDQWPYTKSVIVITDKPQKPLPAAVWEKQKVTA